MADPIVTIEIAFATYPLDPAPSWVDVSTYALEWTTRRGRQHALDRIEAGTATVTLDNSDRRFDPTNTSSPYYPNVLPVRRIRISVTYNATTYYLFDGYIDGWPPSWQESLDGTITITCTDLFLFFNGESFTGTLPGEYSNNAVDTLLDDAFSDVAIAPGPGRLIYAGHTLIEAQTLSDKSILQHLQDIAEAESGLLFIDGQGRTVFQDRHYRLTQSRSTSPIATFGFSGAELPYMDIQPSDDADLIRNDIHITASGGTEQTAEDANSQLQYFKRSYVRGGLLIGDASGAGGSSKDAEALGKAQWILYNSKDPRVRIDAITISGDDDASVWPTQLGGDISDRVRIKWTPPGASVISGDYYIEAIAHRRQASDAGLIWETTWQLSPADVAGWWILDTGALDSTTRLAY